MSTATDDIRHRRPVGARDDDNNGDDNTVAIDLLPVAVAAPHNNDTNHELKSSLYFLANAALSLGYYGLEAYQLASGTSPILKSVTLATGLCSSAASIYQLFTTKDPAIKKMQAINFPCTAILAATEAASLISHAYSAVMGP